MSFLRDFFQRLSSRKFLIVIAAVALKLLYPDIPDELLILVLTYVGVEGARDIVAAVANAKVAKATVEAQSAKDLALISTGDYQDDANSAGKQNIVAGGQ